MIDFTIMQAQLEDNNKQLQNITDLIVSKIGMNDFYLTVDEAADYTRYDATTIKKYRMEIGFSQRGRKIIFLKSDLDKWISKYKTKKQ